MSAFIEAFVSECIARDLSNVEIANLMAKEASGPRGAEFRKAADEPDAPAQPQPIHPSVSSPFLLSRNPQQMRDMSPQMRQQLQHGVTGSELINSHVGAWGGTQALRGAGYGTGFLARRLPLIGSRMGPQGSFGLTGYSPGFYLGTQALTEGSHLLQVGAEDPGHQGKVSPLEREYWSRNNHTAGILPHSEAQATLDNSNSLNSVGDFAHSFGRNFANPIRNTIGVHQQANRAAWETQAASRRTGQINAAAPRIRQFGQAAGIRADKLGIQATQDNPLLYYNDPRFADLRRQFNVHSPQGGASTNPTPVTSPTPVASPPPVPAAAMSAAAMQATAANAPRSLSIRNTPLARAVTEAVFRDRSPALFKTSGILDSMQQFGNNLGRILPWKPRAFSGAVAATGGVLGSLGRAPAANPAPAMGEAAPNAANAPPAAPQPAAPQPQPAAPQPQPQAQPPSPAPTPPPVPTSPPGGIRAPALEHSVATDQRRDVNALAGGAAMQASSAMTGSMFPGAGLGGALAQQATRRDMTQLGQQATAAPQPATQAGPPTPGQALKDNPRDPLAGRAAYQDQNTHNFQQEMNTFTGMSSNLTAAHLQDPQVYNQVNQQLQSLTQQLANQANNMDPQRVQAATQTLQRQRDMLVLSRAQALSPGTPISSMQQIETVMRSNDLKNPFVNRAYKEFGSNPENQTLVQTIAQHTGQDYPTTLGSLFGNMTPAEKAMAFAGLSISAIGLFSAMNGGGMGSGMMALGGLLPMLLGIGGIDNGFAGLSNGIQRLISAFSGGANRPEPEFNANADTAAPAQPGAPAANQTPPPPTGLPPVPGMRRPGPLERILGPQTLNSIAADLQNNPQRAQASITSFMRNLRPEQKQWIRQQLNAGTQSPLIAQHLNQQFAQHGWGGMNFPVSVIDHLRSQPQLLN